VNHWRERLPWTASVIGFFRPDGRTRRKRWLTIAAAVLLIVGAHAGFTALVARRTSRVAADFVDRYGPLDAAQHRPRAIEDDRNQARAVRAATEIMVVPSKQLGSRVKTYEDYGSNTGEPLSSAEMESVRRVIRDNAIVFSLLEIAAGRSQANWELHYERGIEIEVPPLLRLIQLSKLNAAAGRLALEQGRVDDAIAAVRRGTAIADSLANEPILIVHLVRSSVARASTALARRIVGNAELRIEQLAALQSALADSEPRRSLQRAMIVETTAMEPVFRSYNGGDPWSGARWSAGVAMTGGIIHAIARPILLDDERIWLETMSANIAAEDAPRHARGGPRRPPTLRFWNVLSRVILYDNQGIVDRGDLAEAREALARIAVAVERCRTETGRPPASLAALVPTYMNSVPDDPFTGREFRYDTDGTGWQIRSEADLKSIEYAARVDPVLDWARPAPASAPPLAGRREVAERHPPPRSTS